MQIQVENCQSIVGIDQNLFDMIKQAVKCCFEVEEFKIESELSILLVDDQEIREINREHREIDKPTDVLSFPLTDICKGEIEPDALDLDPESGLLLLGDIVISAEKASSQASLYGHSIYREIIFLVTHGVFHLLGYDHANTEDEKVMINKQETVMRKMGLPRGT